MHQTVTDFLSSWKKFYLPRTRPATLLRNTATSSFRVSVHKPLAGLCPRAHGPAEPEVSIRYFLDLKFGENYWLRHLILILLKMKAPKPVKIKAEKKRDYLKITEKRGNGDFIVSPPVELKKLKPKEIKLTLRMHRAGQWHR